MFAIKNLVSGSNVVLSGDRDYLTLVLAQIDTNPSSHEIIEVEDVAE